MRRFKSLLVALVSVQVASTAAFARITFVPTEPFTVARKPDYLAVGDFNRDGMADLVIVAVRSDEVNVLMGAADGRFVRGMVEPFLAQTLSGVAVGDVNQDTLDDIVLTDERGRRQGFIWILLGKGNGTFLEAAPITVSNQPASPILADLDSDGDVDIVYTDPSARERKVFILLNDGGNPPLFARAGEIQVGKQPEELVSGRFDRDNDVDLMVLNIGGPPVKSVSFLRNDGLSGNFPVFREAGEFLVGERAWGTLAVDVDGNGLDDVALLNNPAAIYSNSELQVLFSRGDGLFDGPLQVDVPCPVNVGSGVYCRAQRNRQDLAAGDFDRDGVLDFALTQKEVASGSAIARVYLRFVRGLDGRRFVPKGSYEMEKDPFAVAAGDFTGDGWTDVAVGVRSTSRVTMFVNVSTTPSEPGEPCNDDEDCQSDECIDGICCEDICPPDHTCAVPGHYGECIPLKQNGESCRYAVECLSDFCVDGVCCAVEVCRSGERCSICGFEGNCHKPLPPGQPCCDDNLSCDTGWCTDGVCCLQEVCPEGDICGPEGLCITRPTPTPTPLPPGSPCDSDADCQPGLYCVDNVCCTVPSCPNGYYCSGEQGGICMRGAPPPTRTPTPTRIPSKPPTPPTPVCTPPFKWNGQFCAVVSRGGGCTIQSVNTSDASGVLVLAVLPPLLWFGVRRRCGR